MKVQTHIQGKEESRQESSLGDEEDKELQYYSKYKSLTRNKMMERERKARKKKKNRRENGSSSSSDEDD